MRIAAVAAMLGLGCVPAWAQPASGAPGALDARCDALQQAEFSTIEDAPAQITASRVVQAGGNLPSYCQVQGYIAPNIGMELRLPLSAWNGKFFYAGCTGSCGIAADSFWTRECDYPLTKGYACIVSDMGHRSGPEDGLWAYRNLAAKVDFGFRATHRTAVAGKAITEAFYHEPPRHSYFMGCSTGGRQALVSAQRFPRDFDGIIAGGAVVREAGTAMDFIWNLTRMAPQGNQPLFSQADLKLLHDAALAASDMDDGLRDGIIGNPQASEFDPLRLVCAKGQTTACLTQAQARAAKQIYGGPMNSRGEKAHWAGGLQPGSELDWSIFVAPPGASAPAERSGVDTTRYMLSDWGSSWQASDFDFERDYQRMGEAEALYSAANPDLRTFQAAGGKLMIYQGWADPIIAPMNSVDYYETVEKVMGGREATQDFVRLFMVPGMSHCFGGSGAFAIDYISYLEAWVEQGKPPDALRAAHWAGDHASPSMIRSFPMDRAAEVFTRPVFPYPLRARYQGTGDPGAASSFIAVDPAKPRSRPATPLPLGF